MTGKLAGKVAMITGAGSGIGRAAARLFAAEGAAVAVVDRDDPAAARTAAAIGDAGGSALAVGADVADPGQVDAAFERIAREFGQVDEGGALPCLRRLVIPHWLGHHGGRGHDLAVKIRA